MTRPLGLSGPRRRPPLLRRAARDYLPSNERDEEELAHEHLEDGEGLARRSQRGPGCRSRSS